MFSKIPTKFSAPFGLLGDEAKLAFPSQPNGILKLSTARVRIEELLRAQILTLWQNIPLSDSYWEQVSVDTFSIQTWGIHNMTQYFTLFDSVSEVFSLITPHHSALYALVLVGP